MRPAANDYPEYLGSYIDKVKEASLQEALQENTILLLRTIINSVPIEKENYAYAEGKWTVKQLLIHIADAERIFSYRALRFARGDDQQPLPFEEDEYAANCNAEKRSLKSIIEELIAVRYATAALFDELSEEELSLTGNTSLGKITVKALGYAICGHCLHHITVLKEKYL